MDTGKRESEHQIGRDSGSWTWKPGGAGGLSWAGRLDLMLTLVVDHPLQVSGQV